MSNIDKRALREAAEKALPAMMRLLMMPNDELFDEALLNVDGDVDAANAFNLLAGPETMLALLDELEAKDKQIIQLQQKCEIDPRTHQIIDLKERIAELEAREPDLYLCRVNRGGEELYSPCGKDYPRGRGYIAAGTVKGE